MQVQEAKIEAIREICLVYSNGTSRRWIETNPPIKIGIETLRPSSEMANDISHLFNEQTKFSVREDGHYPNEVSKDEFRLALRTPVHPFKEDH